MSGRYGKLAITTPGSYFFTLQEDLPPPDSVLSLQFSGSNSFNAQLMATNWAWCTASNTIVSSNWVVYDSWTGPDNGTFQPVDNCPFAAVYLRVNSVNGTLGVAFGR